MILVNNNLYVRQIWKVGRGGPCRDDPPSHITSKQITITSVLFDDTLPCKKLAKNSSHKSVIRNSFLAMINAESALVIAQDNCPVSPGPIQAIFGPVPPCPAPVQGQIVPPVETLVEGLIAMHQKVHGKPTYRSFVATNGLPGGIGCCSEGLVPLCTDEVSLVERFGE